MNEIVLKTNDELDVMRVSGRFLASVFAYLDPFIKPGLSTMKIKDLVEDFITNTLNARPVSKGQYVVVKRIWPQFWSFYRTAVPIHSA